MPDVWRRARRSARWYRAQAITDVNKRKKGTITMKNKIFAAVMAAIFIGSLAFMFWPAQIIKAQGYYLPAALSINSSNCVAGATTNTIAATIDARGGKELALGFTGHFLSAGVSNIVIEVTKSVDNVNFEPAASALLLTWVGNGTNVITGCTNFSIGAMPFFRVKVGNASVAGFDCTNTALHYSVK